MSASFDLEAPDHFTAGAVGPAGQRVFYLQGRERRTLVTLKCEKEQVRGLAQYVGGLLEKLKPVSATARVDTDLLEPLEDAWAVASIGVGYDEDRDRIVVVASEFIEEEGQEPATARFQISREQAAAFVKRAQELMQAGRPVCPMCKQPKDPGGHACPQGNGHIVNRE
jgi:uncharacterized repeat protein (TIGR03847 family)